MRRGTWKGRTTNRGRADAGGGLRRGVISFLIYPYDQFNVTIKFIHGTHDHLTAIWQRTFAVSVRHGHEILLPKPQQRQGGQAVQYSRSRVAWQR